MLARPGQPGAPGEVSRRDDSHGRLVDPHTLAARGQGRVTHICSEYTAPDHKLSGIDSVAAGVRAPFDALVQTHAQSEAIRTGKSGAGSSAFGAIRSMVAAATTSQAAAFPVLAPRGQTAPPARSTSGDLLADATTWLWRARAGMSTLPATCKEYLSQGRRFEIIFMAVAVVVLISVVMCARR